MSDSAVPIGVQPAEGIVHKKSSLSVDETVDRLSEAIGTVGAHCSLSSTTAAKPSGLDRLLATQS